LTDEKGNVYSYNTGLDYGSRSYLRRDGLTLSPKLPSDLMLRFTYSSKLSFTDIGSIFSFSLSFNAYNFKDNSISNYKVIFMDINAQKPK